MNATLKSRSDKSVRSVELAYAVLHLLCRGKVKMCGDEARRRLLAGEMLETAEHQIYVAEAMAGRKRAG